MENALRGNDCVLNTRIVVDMKAQLKYGGCVRNGKREVVTEPRPIKGGGPFTNTTMMLNADPRNYSLTNADVGCVLKVKCKPIRSDGYDGEVATSKSTILIKPSETSVVTSENTAVL